MTSRMSRVLIGATALALLTATLGCGVLDKAQDLVNTAGVLADFADRLEKAKTLTYTADYKVTGDDAKTEPKVTIVQQPPNAAFVTKDGRFIFTKDFIYLCNAEKGAMRCQKSVNQAPDVTGADAGMIAGITGAGFVTPELALGLVGMAAFVPGAKVSESSRTIGGQESLCADVTNLEAVAPTPGDNTALHDFSVCITEAGVLASFSGSLTDGHNAKIELSSFSDEADKQAFVPPKGAKIVDITPVTPS